VFAHLRKGARCSSNHSSHHVAPTSRKALTISGPLSHHRAELLRSQSHQTDQSWCDAAQFDCFCPLTRLKHSAGNGAAPGVRPANGTAGIFKGNAPSEREALRIGGLWGQNPATHTGTRGDCTARGTNLTRSI
jgi:hypothetical protein